MEDILRRSKDGFVVRNSVEDQSSVDQAVSTGSFTVYFDLNDREIMGKLRRRLPIVTSLVRVVAKLDTSPARRPALIYSWTEKAAFYQFDEIVDVGRAYLRRCLENLDALAASVLRNLKCDIYISSGLRCVCRFQRIGSKRRQNDWYLGLKDPVD